MPGIQTSNTSSNLAAQKSGSKQGRGALCAAAGGECPSLPLSLSTVCAVCMYVCTTAPQKPRFIHAGWSWERKKKKKEEAAEKLPRKIDVGGGNKKEWYQGGLVRGPRTDISQKENGKRGGGGTRDRETFHTGSQQGGGRVNTNSRGTLGDRCVSATEVSGTCSGIAEIAFALFTFSPSFY